MISKKGKKRSLDAEATPVEKVAPTNTNQSAKAPKKRKTEQAVENGQQKPQPKVQKPQKKEQKAGKPVAKENVTAVKAPVVKTGEEKKKKKQKQGEKEEVEGEAKGANKVVETPEFIKNRIAEIKSRESLSRTAKRKLAVLTKKLRVLEGTAPEEVFKKQAEKSESQKGKNKKEAVAINAQNKTVEAKKAKVQQIEAKPAKQETEPKNAKKQGKQKVQELKKVISEELEDEEDEEEEEDDDVEEDDDDDTSMEVEGEEDDEEDVDEEEDDEEDEDDAEEEEEDDEDDDENEEGVEKTTPVKEKPTPKPKQQEENKEESQKPGAEGDKKKRYVLFVGQLSDDVNEETLKKHFLTKCSEVSSIRIPRQGINNKPRGFAYVEFSSNVDYEKGFSLHNSVLNGRRINVQYSRQERSNMSRQDAVAKNHKLHALSKAGKFGGRQNNRFQKPFHKPGPRPMRS